MYVYLRINTIFNIHTIVITLKFTIDKRKYLFSPSSSYNLIFPRTETHSDNIRQYKQIINRRTISGRSLTTMCYARMRNKRRTKLTRRTSFSLFFDVNSSKRSHTSHAIGIVTLLNYRS